MNVESILERKGTEVATIASEASIKRAADRLRAKNVGALVVTSSNDAILGIISERDIVRAFSQYGEPAQGPVVLVGHSYGGAVITEAGTDPKVAGLVYVTAFAPDKGESVDTLIKSAPPGAPVPPILPPQNGFLFLDRAKFRNSFAADVGEAKAAFLADSQVPWGIAALAGAISEPAWKTKPSWYLIVTEDKMIPPPAQRQMAARAGATVAEVAGSHAIYVSKPETVAALISKAAKSVSSAKAA